MKQEPPLTRSGLLKNCLCEVGIGVVAVLAVVALRGGWRLVNAAVNTIDFWIECGAIGGVILAAATLLAIRDYRRGMAKIVRREEEVMWGKPHDDSAGDEQGND